MFKNVASQKVSLFAFDATTGVPKTGDSANITPYVSKDLGTVTVLGTTTATEMDATNAPGWYSFVLTQGETNGDQLLFTAKSSTANIKVVGRPVDTMPANFTVQSIDSSGRVDVGKIGGTSQTARDVGASVLLAAGQKVDVDTIKTNPVVNAGTVTFPTGATLASTTNITAGTVTTTTNLTNAPTSGDFTSTMKTSLNAATPASVVGAVGSVTGNVGGNVVGSVGSVTGAVASVTGNVGGNVVGTVASVVGAVGSVTGAVGSVTGAVGSVTGAVGSVTGNVGGNVTGSIGSLGATAKTDVSTAVLTTQMTESYASLHTVPTLAQAIFEVRSHIAEQSVSGTTLTTKKIDGSTTATTSTLNDAVSPTSLARAS